LGNLISGNPSVFDNISQSSHDRDWRRGNLPAFLKNPKFIAGAIVAVWVIYVISANFQLKLIEIRLLPFIASIYLKVSTVIICSIIFGAFVTLAIQYQWKRLSSSKPTSVSAAGESSKTVA
jgi:hypothetical protein